MRTHQCLTLLALALLSCSQQAEPSGLAESVVDLPLCNPTSFITAEGDTLDYYSELVQGTDDYFFEMSFNVDPDEDQSSVLREVQIVSSKRSGAIKSILMKNGHGHTYVALDSCRVITFERSP